MMRRMTIDAAHVVLQVRRPRVVAVLFVVTMAAQTTAADLLRRGILEREYLRFVAAAVDVGFPRTMAGLASMPLRPLFRIERGYEMRRRFIILEKVFRGHVFMAGLAGFRSDVKSGIGGALVFLGLLARSGVILIFFIVLIVLRQSGNNQQRRAYQAGKRQENRGHIELPPGAHSHPITPGGRSGPLAFLKTHYRGASRRF